MKKRKKKKNKKATSLSNSKLSSLLFDIFRESPSVFFNYRQLSKKLKIKDSGGKKQVVVVLEELKKNNLLAEASLGKYHLSKKAASFTASVYKSSKDGAYVFFENLGKVFVPKEFSLFSAKGDLVECFVLKKKKNYFLGRVVSVLKRRKKTFVGVIDGSSTNNFLIPDDKTVPFDVFIPKERRATDYSGKKIVVEVVSWSEKYKNPVGKVVKVLGFSSSVRVELDSILYDHGIARFFPEKVTAAANKLDDVVSKKEVARRLDLRSVPTITIDPDDAKDFDDAISLRKVGGSAYEVGVHIADVSHYVGVGGVIDIEARKRATSIYLVDRVVPMLPETLSNNLCSLRPQVDRLAFSVIFTFSVDGAVLNYRIKKTVVHSDVRLTYKEAQNILDNKKGSFSKELLLLSSFSKKLKKERLKNGSLAFDGAEVKFDLNESLEPVDVYYKELLSTNSLVEEFMLLANKTVAEHVCFLKIRSLNFVYRVHDAPDLEKISNLASFVKKLGYSIRLENPGSISSSLNSLLKKVKGRPEQKMIETLVVRSMSKALYSTKKEGHYGLGLLHYTHFTSPIRRYADLVVHRVLNSLISGAPFESLEIEDICSHCSAMEKASSAVERASIDYMQAVFLKKKVGDVFLGVISGVVDWGLYVTLNNNGCEGLVSFSRLKDDHYFFDEKTYSIKGYRSNKEYRLGDNIKVRVLSSDLAKKHVSFDLA